MDIVFNFYKFHKNGFQKNILMFFVLIIMRSNSQTVEPIEKCYPFSPNIFTHAPCGSVVQQMDIFSFSFFFSLFSTLQTFSFSQVQKMWGAWVLRCDAILLYMFSSFGRATIFLCGHYLFTLQRSNSYNAELIDVCNTLLESGNHDISQYIFGYALLFLKVLQKQFFFIW